MSHIIIIITGIIKTAVGVVAVDPALIRFICFVGTLTAEILRIHSLREFAILLTSTFGDR